MTALLIGCLATNEPAHRFYEALGGRVVAEREFDQDGVLLPEVVYGWADTRVFTISVHAAGSSPAAWSSVA